MGPERQLEQPSPRDQLAALALPIEQAQNQTASPVKDPIKKQPFIRQLRAMPRRTEELVGFLLEYLDVSINLEILERIANSTRAVQPLSLEEQVKIGRTVPPESPISLALVELDQAVWDVYGPVFDGELHYSKAIALHMVEQAQAEQTGHSAAS